MTGSKKHHFDYILLGVSFILIVLGILVLANVSANFSQEKFGRTTYYLFHQAIYGLGIGVALAFFVFMIGIKPIKRMALPLILVNLVFMGLVFIPKLGIIAGGAPRWMNLGFVSFQPSEFLKLTFIIYLAAWLASRTKKSLSKGQKANPNFTLLPFLSVVGFISLFLVMQSDISTLGVIVIAAILMYFSTSTPIWHTIFIILIGGGGLLALIRTSPYRMRRISVFLNPETDPMGIGYQINQALIAVGSGGLFGLGLGMSNQKFGFIPQTMSDSIFAIFAEEMGFAGSFVLIALFIVFLWRGFKIAKNAQDNFSKIFAIGFSSWICVQAFVNIGAMIGILPLTGIPLPFMSYGGSHFIVELIGLGILLNISKAGQR